MADSKGNTGNYEEVLPGLLISEIGLFEADNKQLPAPSVNIGRLTVGMTFKKQRPGRQVSRRA